ncbi:hypothetical protein [Streptomyces griseofuscus]|uniref:hypothetical protein n=1 Tax=Streptomyces griseofuscus TaxID=146922 RepID=UPI001C0EE9BB|nr:hypothetical protein [Streptomyces griseofuscus]
MALRPWTDFHHHAHLQACGLDHGLELGNRSADILARVRCSRAKDCIRELNTALAPWLLRTLVSSAQG